MAKKNTYKEELVKWIQKNSKLHVFKFSKKELEKLEFKDKEFVKLGSYYYQIFQSEDNYYLFRLSTSKPKSPEKDLVFDDRTFTIKGEERLIIDITGWKKGDKIEIPEQPVRIHTEKIDVSDLPPAEEKFVELTEKYFELSEKLNETLNGKKISQKDDFVLEEKIVKSKVADSDAFSEVAKDSATPKADSTKEEPYASGDRADGEKTNPSTSLEKEATDSASKSLGQKTETESSYDRTSQESSTTEEVVTTGDTFSTPSDKKIFDNVEDIPPPPPEIPVPPVIPNIEEIPKPTWFEENFSKYGEAQEGGTYESSINQVSQYGSYEDSNSQHFWITLEQDIKDTDLFWKELRIYYKVNPSDLSFRLGPLDETERGPVFSKSLLKDVDLVDLQTVIASKISERIESLKESKDLLSKQLLGIGDSLARQGVSLSQDADYENLYREQKEIADCIEQAHETLDKYSNYIESLSEETNDVVNKSVLDIHGTPDLISRHYEKVISKLVDLNLEINYVKERHQQLEQELIKRLKDVEDAKEFKERLASLEREGILSEYQEENLESIAEKDRREIYEELGSLNESTAFIQQKIEEENKKINYYMNNLKGLSSYENYEETVFKHYAKKKEHRREIQKLRKEIYKIRLYLLRKEKRHNEFFDGVDQEVHSLREDIVEACSENQRLIDKCLNTWRDKWEKEGIPLMDEMYTRTSRIISAFAPFPATQIVRIYKLRDRLIKETKDRQKEWERIFSEIKKEFRDMNYELETPAVSELDQKYLDKLDDASLNLSKETRQTIFLPEGQFKLSNHKDERIGLDPKTTDDDDFLIIDQVWETLTPEQEKILEAKLAQNKEEDRQETKDLLLQNQLQQIKDRFPVEQETMEITTRGLSETDKKEKYKEIESSELQLWRGDNYLIANSKGEFRGLLYEITKKLFSTKSARFVDGSVEFTDTGLVKDGHTEILSSKDYFIKPEDRDPFKNSTDELDLSDIADIHSEPDAEMIELLSDPTYVSHAREREERLAKLTAPLKPSAAEWAQITLKKYTEEKGRIYEVETLKGRLLEMEDEIKALKKYHDTKGAQLDKALEERDSAFEELKGEIDKTKDFLSEQQKQLRGILKETDKEIDDKVEKSQEELFSEVKLNKTKRHGLIYWLGRWLQNRRKGDQDDFTTV